MKIFSSTQIRAWDQATIENEPISAYLLMERAATACYQWMTENLCLEKKVYIFCGNGNNGGDGMAIARMLYLKGIEVYVFLDENQVYFSPNAETNLLKLKQFSGISIYDFSKINLLDIPEDVVFIDALFGTGLNRELTGKVAELITFLNTKKTRKISIDLPSGLFPDKSPNRDAIIFNAEDTLSFQAWKRTFMHPETGKHCGRIHILDIGLDLNFIEKAKSYYYSVDLPHIKKMYIPRPAFSHKGDFGKTCIVGGSFGKIGACVMATKAALRTGSGITFALAPKCGFYILQNACPQAMFLYGGEDHLTHFVLDEDFTYGIGPGLGTDPETETALIDFLLQQKKPLVLDADALNILSKNPDYLNHLPENTILTPHPKEFERLFGKAKDSFERLTLAQEKSKALKIIIVLKDHHTQTCCPDGEIYYNTSGNAGMAKGGSGDVLTGIITALLAQGYSPKDAAIFGVWLHGKAADLALAQQSMESLLPTDGIAYLSQVFQLLQKELM